MCSLNRWTLYFTLMTCFIFSFFFSFSVRRWWSEAASAPLFSLESNTDLLNFLEQHTKSIWFSVTWSGDTHVFLCILLCWKMLPPIQGRVVGHTPSLEYQLVLFKSFPSTTRIFLKKSKWAPSTLVWYKSFPSKAQSICGALFRNIRHYLSGSPPPPRETFSICWWRCKRLKFNYLLLA